MIFHAWSVVVMLNMLVAMMSHSFDRVRNNAELEWKFHRSVMWMKFIRKGIYPRPPPMNLIPSTRDLRSAYNFIRVRSIYLSFPLPAWFLLKVAEKYTLSPRLSFRLRRRAAWFIWHCARSVIKKILAAGSLPKLAMCRSIFGKSTKSLFPIET